MRVGLQIYNKGPNAGRELMRDCARIADSMPVDDLWVFDHLAIPLDNARGSDGIYFEPLATLAFVAGITERVGIGTRVLILPYRPPVLTYKWVSTIQALSGGRLTLGTGVGWLAEEFKVLGVDRSRRGQLADKALETLNACFASDTVDVDGKPVYLLPRPKRPPILVGGNPPHALERIARYADGWMPPGDEPDKLKAPIETLTRLMKDAGKPAPEVMVMLTPPLDDEALLHDRMAALAEIGVTRVGVNPPTETPAGFAALAERMVRAREGI